MVWLCDTEDIMNVSTKLSGIRFVNESPLEKLIEGYIIADEHEKVEEQITGSNELSPNGRVKGKYFLHLACHRGAVKCVKTLIKMGADVNMTELFREYQGFTPLMFALDHRSPQVADALIEHKVDVRRLAKSGTHALLLLCQNKTSLKVWKHFVKDNHDLLLLSSTTRRVKVTALEELCDMPKSHAAISDWIEFLIQETSFNVPKWVRVAGVTLTGLEYLLMQVPYVPKGLLIHFLDQWQEPNELNDIVNDNLQYKSNRGHPLVRYSQKMGADMDVVMELVKRGYSINHCDLYGDTLLSACLGRHSPVLKRQELITLLEHGADVTITSPRLRKSLLKAASRLGSWASNLIHLHGGLPLPVEMSDPALQVYKMSMPTLQRLALIEVNKSMVGLNHAATIETWNLSHLKDTLFQAKAI